MLFPLWKIIACIIISMMSETNSLSQYKEGVSLKKAIFGGTFDPIHIGHIHIAYEALYNLNLDKIIFMPAGNPPHKNKKKITDAQIRYDLVKRAIESEEHFEISDYEINKKENSYTYETVELFSELQRNIEWYSCDSQWTWINGKCG
jgi:nicotinate (nicotinamide) nucleotide adenylyltransferase